MLDLEKKYDMQDNGNFGQLDLSQLNLSIDVAAINELPNEQYALLRKHGLGTSDSSIICGVNPYTTIEELIEEKCRDYLTEEEKAVGNKAAVKKGRDLEPLIIEKHSKILGKQIIKPTDMYRHNDFPWLKFNFDGVIDKLEYADGTYQYIPDEIKVVTRYGQKHYNPGLAYYRESIGYLPMPKDHSQENNSTVTKAAQYGIPPYYYTQLQQQIFGLQAPFGYLTVMFDDTWELVSFMIYRDENVISDILTNGYKTWQEIIKRTGNPNRENVSRVLESFSAPPAAGLVPPAAGPSEVVRV